MLKYLLLAALLFAASPALAQQQQLSPPETALQINGVVGQWAQTLVQQGKVIEQLQAELAKANARIKELEAKPVEKPAETPAKK
jgi:uncharacterized coiled-coil protein SlyX